MGTPCEQTDTSESITFLQLRWQVVIKTGSSPVADPVAGWGGWARNMKSRQPPLAAIFYMTYFYRAGDPLIGRSKGVRDSPLNGPKIPFY